MRKQTYLNNFVLLPFLTVKITCFFIIIIIINNQYILLILVEIICIIVTILLLLLLPLFLISIFIKIYGLTSIADYYAFVIRKNYIFFYFLSTFAFTLYLYLYITNKYPYNHIIYMCTKMFVCACIFTFSLSITHYFY